MSNKIFIFLILCVGLWLSTLLISFSLIFKITYFLFYESLLIYFFYFSRSSKLASLLAFSTFLYFYQVPLMDFFPQDKLGIYSYTLNLDIQFEAYAIYNMVLLCIFILLNYLVIRPNIEKQIISLRNEKIILLIFYISTVFSLLLLLYTISNSRGIENYLILNKFEASQAQKFLLFTYKDFATISIATGFLSRNKKITYFTFLLVVVFLLFEILSAKRMMLLIIATYFFLLKINRFRYKHLFLVGVAIFLITLIKFIYYNIRLFILGQSSFKDIFWFDWGDVLLDSIFINEARGHITLLINYLYRDIKIHPSHFSDQIIASAPFGHHIIDNYISAGEYLRIILNEPWNGLASSQYIIPYFSIGFLGIVLVYCLQLGILSAFNKLLSEKSYVYPKLLFLINTPVLLFYSHREEIIVIIKSLIITSTTLGLVFLVAYLFKIFYRGLHYG